MSFTGPYLYPGTQVLRNKAGIRDGQALREFEYEQTKWRIEELREHPIAGKFDLAHMQAIHAHIFQDVYEWAGELRTVGISKGASMFAQSPYIEGEAKRLSVSLAAENYLRGLDKPRFVERLAHYYAEWNALHPFREGNGRSTREFIGQLAREAGYEFDQTRIDNDKDRWNDAARRSFNGDLEPVKRIFTEAVQPGRALASASGLVRACEAKAGADGLDERQRAIVMARVRRNVAGSLTRGDTPEVKIREERQVETGPSRDKEL